ncbi:MAG: hypothetical protein JOZ58_14055 [Acetobacteraceae bacterium]|nr:hypothetical protein [Acetobacteraceae bacterium]
MRRLWAPSFVTEVRAAAVQTNPGKAWWVWFRWYGLTEKFFDKSWKLPDFDLVK